MKDRPDSETRAERKQGLKRLAETRTWLRTGKEGDEGETESLQRNYGVCRLKLPRVDDRIIAIICSTVYLCGNGQCNIFHTYPIESHNKRGEDTAPSASRLHIHLCSCCFRMM